MSLIFVCLLKLFVLGVDNSQNMLIKDGLYHGQKKGFFPSSLVYVRINQDRALVECYLPLKGEYFQVVKDTLNFVSEGDRLFEGSKSLIYERKEKLYFKTLKEGNEYNIRETKIQYQPNMEQDLIKVRRKAKPFND